MNDLSKKDDARADYLKGMKYKDIATKYHVSINTVKSWKSRYWNKENVPRLKPKKVAHKNDEVAHKAATNDGQQNEHGLNPQQEYYCELRAKQYPQYSAYRIAYDANYKLANATVATNASLLERHDKIRQRITKLIETRTNAYKWDTDVAIEKVSELFFKSMESILIHGITKSNSDSAYNAFDRLNKLVGLDMLTRLQKNKLVAEIEVIQAKAKQYNGSDNQQMSQLNVLLDQLKSTTEDDENGSK